MMEQTTQKGLVRGIGRWDLVALTINSMVGAGIFGLPSRIYALTGTWSVLAYLVCAALVTFITLCFAEVGSRFAETGGPYLYARAAFGPAIGFEVGWLLWLARMTAFAALCNLLLIYLSFFWPGADSGWTRTLVITVVVIALTTVNVIGVRESALVNNLFVIAKLTPLLLFVVAGFFFLSPHLFTAPAAPDSADFSMAVLLLVFAFSGFEMAVIPAGEIRDPQRHIAFALLTATGVVALLYLMIQVVCIGTLPGLANSERPLVDASSRFLGAAGASIVSAGALISVTGTLNSNMLTGPRILFAMAEQGQLPRPLAATHRRFRTPHVAILTSSAVMLILTLQGTFMSALTISTVIRLLAYVATCIALPVLRFKNDAPLPRFSAPAGAAVAVVATTLSVWLLSHSPSNDARAACLAAGLGLLIFFSQGKTGRADRCRALTQANTEGETMFNISSIYPKKEGYRFDFDYYLNQHMPMSIALLSGAKGFRGVSVERGIEIDEPRIESSYVAMCHYYFDSLENFLAAFMPHAKELQGDIVNYTNIEPTIQVNEVEITKQQPT